MSKSGGIFLYFIKKNKNSKQLIWKNRDIMENDKKKKEKRKKVGGSFVEWD